MLDKVKLALRLSGTALDGEVSDLINAAIADLRLVGINIPAEAGSSSKTLGDPLLDRAVVLYAKAEFGFNDDAERYRNAYDYLKCALSLTADYIESGVAGAVAAAAAPGADVSPGTRPRRGPARARPLTWRGVFRWDHLF